MNEEYRKSLKEKGQPEAEESVGSFITRIAFITLFWFFVLIALAAAVIGCLFPKAYMNLYRAMGLYEKASHYAEVSAERVGHDIENCDGRCEYSSYLVVGVDCASLANNYQREYDLTKAYLSTPCHAKRSATIDAKYIEGLADEPSALSVIYGYDDHVHAQYVRSALALDKDNESSEFVTASMQNPNLGTVSMLIEYTAVRSGGVDMSKAKNICVGFGELLSETDVTTGGKTDIVKVATKGSGLYRLRLLAENLYRLGVMSEADASRAKTAYTDFIKSLPANNIVVNFSI